MTGRRPGLAVLAVAALAVAGVAAANEGSSGDRDDRPNIVLIVSDDQTAESFDVAEAMPSLHRAFADPSGGWIRFPNTFATTPLCCPARATLLTGRTSAATGVLDNTEGASLDDSETVAPALHEHGYATALVGKYLNGYPFPGRPLVPPGWDRWIAKTNTADETVYGGYSLIVDGAPRAVGAGPWTYSTDLLAAEAARVIGSMPPDRPFFLYFAPPAPHRPWIPAPGDAGALSGLTFDDPAAVGERDVSDKPAWVRALPELEPDDLERLRESRRREYETLLALDDALRTIDEALAAREALDDTIVLFLTDNGYALGEHRWETKSCPYDVCTRVPLAIRVPGADARIDERLVANTQVAPTIAALAGIPPLPGAAPSLAPALEDADATSPGAIELEFLGEDPVVPRWRGIRTRAMSFVVYETGERELYDLAGILGPPDPDQLDNRADDPRYAELRARLEATLPTTWDVPAGGEP